MKNFLLIVENQLPFFCGPKDGGKYDLSDACPVCGTGARRLDPIKLPSARLKNRVSITLKHEVIIPPRLVEGLKSLAPHCLREIKDAKTGATTQFSELISEITLPRWSAATTGWCLSEIVTQCPTCKRDGFFNVTKEPLALEYENIPDFSVAETYEHFGKSRLNLDFTKSLFAVPFLVVNEALQEMLDEERGIKFVEVKIGK